jgi:excisionase family DNA binding protein
MTATIPPAADSRLLLTRREAAHALGVSERKLFDLTRDNHVPHVRLGARGVRYPVDQLKAWIAAQSIAPQVG